MENKTLLATYADLPTAQETVGDLLGKDYARENIGLAQRPRDGSALVTVTTAEDRQPLAEQILKQHTPQTFDIRETGWRDDGSVDHREPNVDQYEAVELAEKRSSQA